jgi:CRP-like cAMP-binding protein
MAVKDPTVFRNSILSRLDDSERRAIEPHLHDVDLPVRKMLEPRQRRIDNIYFIESGFASVVAFDGKKTPIEVGIIGREGMSGLSVVFGGTEKPDNDTYMQSDGRGWRIKVSDLKEALDECPSLHRALLRYGNSFLNQMTRTVVANGRGKIEERLARWILMASDRLDGDELQLTQEFLAMMLAVRRSGVTVAVQALERKGLIERTRGSIKISDRIGLMAMCNGSYIAADYE